MEKKPFDNQTISKCLQKATGKENYTKNWGIGVGGGSGWV